MGGLRLLAFGAVCLALHTPSLAYMEGITPGELALTPEFCQDVQTINGWSKSRPSPRAPHWIGLMGENFWHMHHYCWAMIGLHRAEAAGLTPMDRHWLIKQAVADYRYIIINSTPDFVLLPEVYTRMGDAQLLMGDVGGAYDSFSRAREIKPDYWPPYAKWAAVLIKINKTSEAKELVEAGLRHSPDAAPLREQYRKLGGDPQTVQATGKDSGAARKPAGVAPPATTSR